MNRRLVSKLCVLSDRLQGVSASAVTFSKKLKGFYPSLRRRISYSFLLLSLPSISLLEGSPSDSGQKSQIPLNAQIASSIQAVSNEKIHAVVRIRSFDAHGEVDGTGFFIDPTGTVCTLAEVVRDGKDFAILQDGMEYPATLQATDSRSGVAFLKSSGTNSSSYFISPSPRSGIPPLSPVIGIGFPRGGQPTSVLGMVTGTETHDGKFYYCVPHLVARIPLSEGEGGAPIFDLSGELLGMVVTGNTQEGISKILPSAAIEKLDHDLMSFGHLNPGWVGVVVDEVAVPQSNSRTRIVSVEAGSPAEKAGLRKGDLLLSIGDNSICYPEEVLGASFYLSAGDSITVDVLRNGETKRVTLHCISRPEENK